MKKEKTPHWKARSLEELTNIKSVKDLYSLPTMRLLAYYKAERMRKIRYCETFNDDDGEYTFQYYKKYEYAKDILSKWEDYLITIKTVLNTRGNVESKRKITQ